jgi:hypothetical protein
MFAHRYDGVANRADAFEITVNPFDLIGKALPRCRKSAVVSVRQDKWLAE